MEETPRENPTPRLPRAAGPARLDRIKDIYYMSLEGSYEEMGAQMAELARGITDTAILDYYRGLPEKLIAHSFAADISKSLPPRVAAALYSVFYRFSKKNGERGFDAFLRAYTQTAGLPPRAAIDFTLFADVLHYLAGRAFTPMAMPGCSGFFARGRATAGGKVIIGRNFDFYGRGLWEKYQTLLVIRPSDAQHYMWLGALGVPFGGFGINKSGIAIMPFTNFTRDVTVRGRLIYPTFLDIMETATCLDDVVKVIAAGPRTVGLSLLAVDTRARDARAVGFSAHRMEALDPKDDYLVRTNHYLTEQMHEVEVAPTAWRRHSTSRFTRIVHRIREEYGRLTPRDAVGIMSDVIDPFEHRRRVVGGLVAATNNANSLVLSPDDDAIFIANGEFPVCHSEKFLGFRISALFAGDLENAAIDDLPGAGQLNETEREALDCYTEAWSAYLENHDITRAVQLLRRAAVVLPDEPIFHRVAGMLLLKSGKYQEAIYHLEINAAPNYRQKRIKAETRLWAGRCYDLLGVRDRALEYYNHALALEDIEISPAASRNLERPFRKKDLKHVDIEFVTGGAIAKYF